MSDRTKETPECVTIDAGEDGLAVMEAYLGKTLTVFMGGKEETGELTHVHRVDGEIILNLDNRHIITPTRWITVQD